MSSSFLEVCVDAPHRLGDGYVPWRPLTALTLELRASRNPVDKKPPEMYLKKPVLIVQKVVVSNILLFSSLLGGRCPNLTHIFQMGWKHQLV